MKRPWKDKPIVEKIKENGVNELLADNPANFAEQAEENNYYVKYYYLENPLNPSEKKILLAKMIKAALDKSRDNDVINMDSRIINNMIVMGDEGAGEGNFCANQGIKSAIECAQFLQKRIDPANRTIDPRHIILVMGEEEDRSERQRREKFCFKGALDNDETTKVRCNTLKRITIDTTPQDFQDVNDDDPQGEPIEFNDESMSASKVRLSIANDSSNDFQLVRQLYSEYLNDEDIEFMINNVRSGLYIQGASPPLPLPQQRRYNSRFIPEQQRQFVDQQGVLDSAKKHYAAAFWTRTGAARAFGLGKLGEADVPQELSDVRENDGLPASLDSNPKTSGSANASEDTQGGRKKKRKTRRKYKRKSRTRKKNRSVSTTRKKNIKTRRSQIGCKGKNTKRHRR